MLPNYIDYTAEDFATDEFFQTWVYELNNQASAFWDDWLHEHSEKTIEVEKAKAILLSLRFQETKVSPVIVQGSFEKLQTKISRERYSSYHNRYWNPYNDWFRVAAAIGGIIIIAGIYIILNNEVYNTNYTSFGEMKSITLPDGSSVTLNANSVLKYNKNWRPDEPREVWLNGEGYFKIVKTPGRKDGRFIVHSGLLDVEVLGTQFNVSNRRGKTKVVLNTGKIKLAASEKKEVPKVILNPGEMVEFSKNHKELVTRKVDPQLYISWKNKKLIFEDTPIIDIALLLEDNYGLDVKIEDENLKRRELTGEIRVENEDVLLNYLAKVLEIDIHREGDDVIFKK